MTYTERIEVRLTERETANLARLRERSGRTASDLIRTLLRQLDPEELTTGLPSPTRLRAAAFERDKQAA